MTDLSKIPDDELLRMYESQRSLANVSDAELLRMYQQQRGTPTAAPDVSALAAPVIGLGHGIDRLAAGLKSGARGLLGDSFVNTVDKVGSALGMADSSKLESSQVGNEAEYEKLREARPVGTFVGDMATSALGGTNPIGMGLIGALEYGTPEERAMRGGAGYFGGKVGEKIAGAVANRLTRAAPVETARDATIKEMRDAGLVLPPSQVNPRDPGIVNRLSEGVAGKLTTAQLAGIKNQPKIVAIAKQELGIPADKELTLDAVKAVRKRAGGAYEAVKNVGTVPVDDAFAAQLGESIGPYAQLAGQFPSRRVKDVDDLIKDLTQPQMEAGAIVDLVKNLRYNGFRNVKSPDPKVSTLGKIEIGAQEALEDLLDRHLAQTGERALLSDYRAARTLIAKSHTVENALEESTGNIVASKIGKEFSKGRPLTGGLATIGKAAEAFPKAVQNMNTSMPGMSPLDALGAIAGAGVTGNAAGAALPGIRPLLRSAILSPQYQSMFASPQSAGLLNQLSPSNAALLRDLLQGGGGLLGGTIGMSGQ